MIDGVDALSEGGRKQFRDESTIVSELEPYCPLLRLTTRASRFVIEDGDDHDRSRVVVHECAHRLFSRIGIRDGL